MWVFPPLLWSFPPTATLTSFPAPGCWVCVAAPAFSRWNVVMDFPSPALRHSGYPALFATCLFLLLLLIIQFFILFSLGGSSVCPGGYADLAQGCLWEYHVLLSSPCGLCLPKPSGCCHLAVAWKPSWFLHLTWSGDAMHQLEVWRSQSFASFQWFFPVRCISNVSPRFYFRRHAFCFLPLAVTLKSSKLIFTILIQSFNTPRRRWMPESMVFHLTSRAFISPLRTLAVKWLPLSESIFSTTPNLGWCVLVMP
jgi:hypothetical protein